MGERRERLLARNDAWRESTQAKDAERKAERAARAAAHTPAEPATPEEQALAAYEAGEGFLELQMEVGASLRRTPTWRPGENHRVSEHTTDPTGTLEAIEAIGWHLEHVGYVFVVTGQNSVDRALSSGQETAVSGKTVGIYLFRRAH